MAVEGLVRTDYWNRVTGSVRIGDTRRDETITDVEDFLLPYGQAATVGLHLWGIAAGLTVTATADQPGLRISPGSAIDAAGHLIVLACGGTAVTDPDIDPADVANIATAAVDSAGVSLPTAGDTGARYVTVRYLEVSVEGLLGNSPALVHAPWLRVVDATGFSDDGTDVVLAQVSLDNGTVTALSAELRRLAGLPAGRLQLRRPTTGTGAGLTVEHTPAAELRARPDGGVVLAVLDPSSRPTTALTVDSAGRIGIGAARPQRPLHVEGAQIHSGGPEGGLSFADRTSDSFIENPDAGQRWVWYAHGGTARLWSGSDRLSVTANGNMSIGIEQARRRLHVEGSEIHSGGSKGGLSFADRPTGSFVENPDAGQRWVWYAQDGTARLWSGEDRLSVAPSGRIGIGTTVPAAKLHVKGAEEGIRVQGPATGNANVAYVSFVDSAGTRIGYVGDGSTADVNVFVTSDRGDVVLNTAAGRNLTATSTGNVGVGTTTPGNHLEVATGDAYAATLSGLAPSLYFAPAVGQFPNPGGNPSQAQAAFIGFGTRPGDYGGGLGDLNLGTQSRSATNSSAIRFLAPSDDVGNYAERMRISRDGNVGIATSTPAERLHVEGNIRASGRAILNGADCAEDFDAKDAQALEPGTVMVIGDEDRLHQSEEPYDKRVAGVLSGAGDYQPGIILRSIILGQQQSHSNRLPLALTGKVFCKVDAQYSPIGVGDLLTTSPTLGHAMKVTDPLQAFGAVIGKALRPMAEGQGLIPILVALQ